MNIQSTNRKQNTNFGAFKVNRNDFRSISRVGLTTPISITNEIKLKGNVPAIDTFMTSLERNDYSTIFSPNELSQINQLIQYRQYSEAIETVKKMNETAEYIPQGLLDTFTTKNYALNDKEYIAKLTDIIPDTLID